MNLSQLCTALSQVYKWWIHPNGMHRPDAKRQLDALSSAREFFDLLEVLRADEGDSVSFVSENPDFNGQPNCLVICCGGWTGWQDQRFAEDTVLECLRAAKQAREQAAIDAPPGSSPAREVAGENPLPSTGPFFDLVREFNRIVEHSNPYAYFELARTRSTEWMAFICDKAPNGVTGRPEPDRVILAQGQGHTPDEACAEALEILNQNVPV